MSTRTFNNTPPGGDARALALFVAVSVAVHLLGLVALSAFTELKGLLLAAPERDRPIVVDVVELPPGPESEVKDRNAPPEHFAQRDQSVEKETVPRVPRGIPGAAATPPSAPAVEAPRPSPPSEEKAPKRAEKPAPVEKSADRPAEEKPAEKGLPEAAAETPTQATEPVPVKEAAERAPALNKQAEGAEKTPGARVLAPKAPAVDKAAPGGPGAGAASGAPGSAAGTGKPDLFLSDERLAELAEKYRHQAPDKEEGKTLRLNTSELRYQKYLVDMKRRIEFRWEYPLLAVKNAWQGVLRIDFEIKKDGSLGKIELVKSSGYPVLDDAAITAIRLSEPFASFPEDFAIEKINVKAQFEYLLRGPPPGGR